MLLGHDLLMTNVANVAAHNAFEIPHPLMATFLISGMGHADISNVAILGGSPGGVGSAQLAARGSSLLRSDVRIPVTKENRGTFVAMLDEGSVARPSAWEGAPTGRVDAHGTAPFHSPLDFLVQAEHQRVIHGAHALREGRDTPFLLPSAFHASRAGGHWSASARMAAAGAAANGRAGSGSGAEAAPPRGAGRARPLPVAAAGFEGRSPLHIPDDDDDDDDEEDEEGEGGSEVGDHSGFTGARTSGARSDSAGVSPIWAVGPPAAAATGQQRRAHNDRENSAEVRHDEAPRGAPGGRSASEEGEEDSTSQASVSTQEDDTASSGTDGSEVLEAASEEGSSEPSVRRVGDVGALMAYFASHPGHPAEYDVRLLGGAADSDFALQRPETSPLGNDLDPDEADHWDRVRRRGNQRNPDLSAEMRAGRVSSYSPSMSGSRSEEPSSAAPPRHSMLLYPGDSAAASVER